MTDAIAKDALDLLCGKELGAGIHRKVFECRLRPDLVVKVEQEDTPWRSFANAQEMRFWCDYMHCPDVAKWLAPCEFMSPDGRLLLQRKVQPVPSDYKLPPRLPEFLTDIKRDNFGLLDGKLVCVDYAMLVLNPSLKMQKVEWN